MSNLPLHLQALLDGVEKKVEEADREWIATKYLNIGWNTYAKSVHLRIHTLMITFDYDYKFHLKEN